MTFTGPNAFGPGRATATSPIFTIASPTPPPAPATHFDAKTWIGIFAALATAVLVIIGGAAWMHGNIDKRIDRLEGRYDTAHAETTKTLVDIQVQLATLAASKQAADQPTR
jgi:hypothetical protein